VEQAIVVFDAECVLCSANAQLILRNDRRRLFRLASMQGPAGRSLLRAHGVDPDDPDTIIVVAGPRVLRNSDAVLFIYSQLGGPWRAAALARAVPRALRDRLYRWVARNRYRLFGKRAECWVPDAADRDRLL
jgi:predicted DCC family thiol-disulfide oxidoreductase YuxK